MYLHAGNTCHSDDRDTEYLSTEYISYSFKGTMVILEGPTVTVKCRTAIKAMFFLFFFNLYPSVKFDILSCSFTSIAFLTNYQLLKFAPYSFHLKMHINMTVLANKIVDIKRRISGITFIGYAQNRKIGKWRHKIVSKRLIY